MYLCVIPARNERPNLAGALASVMSQSPLPERVIISVDPSTDGTLGHARYLAGGNPRISVVEGPGLGSKAHNINHVLEGEDLSSYEAVLILDADSCLDPHFMDEALRVLRGDGSLGALCGTFRGRSRGYLAFCQQSEYLRYARDNARRFGRVLTLSGTSMVVRGSVLEEVRREYGRFFPTDSLTEDLKLSCEIMRLGHRIAAPPSLTLSTETMDSWRKLFRQRLRWREGAVITALQMGFGRGTRELSLRLLWGFVGSLVITLYLVTLLYGLIFGMSPNPFFLSLAAVFSLEQFATVYRRGGIFRAIIGALLLPEMPYTVFITLVHLLAYLRAPLRVSRSW